MRSLLKNHEFTIISANCIGGVLTHDLGEQFRSPTINLIIPEYLKFINNLSHYLSVLPTLDKACWKNGCPTCFVGDVEIIGVHYPSPEKLIADWTKRARRVNFGNIFLIATDNYIKTEEQKVGFNLLPYPKVCFTAHQNSKYEWHCYLPEFEGCDEIGDCLRYCDLFGTRIFEKHFDCINWLNRTPANN